MTIGKGDVTVDRKELEAVHEKLIQFMKQLPEKDQQVLEVVLARAAAAKEEYRDEIDEHLDFAAKRPGAPTLAMLAKALDGEPKYLGEGPDEFGKLWSYTFWTYHHK